VVITVLFAATRGLADKRDNELDEREIGLRDRAYRSAYAFAAYAFFPAALVLAYWFPERGFIQTLWAFAAGWLIFWGIPTSLLAWTEPEEELVEV
jgi:hypothetical protein